MMKTVTSLFQTEQHATAAVTHLEQAGIPKAGIDIWSTPHNLAPLLEDAGVSRHDAQAYVEGVLSGGTLVIVRCSDDEVGTAVGILDREGVLDVDELRTSRRLQEEQDDAHAGLPDGTDEASSPARATPDMAASSPPERMGHGRIRVHTGPAESPARK
jgi:hypothetical protein